MDPFLYLDRDTFVHRLDPRTKMFLLVGAFVLTFLFVNPLYQLGALALVLLFGALARSLVNLKRIWFILVMVGLMTVILWSIFASGETSLVWFVEREAVLYGIGIALRIDITIIAGMIFLSTTRNEEIATGLVKLGLPYRFAFAISTALRLVPTIAATGSTIGQAQRSRGLDLESGNLLQKEEHSASDPSLRLDDPLDQRVQHGAGVEGVWGEPGPHLFSAARDGTPGRAGSASVRVVARRRGGAAAHGLRRAGGL